MAINPYFNFYNAANEQNLLENLIIESIRIYGFNTYYMPRHLDNFDKIFRESSASTFSQAFVIEAYLKDNLKFEGDGKFMSRELGLEIRDQSIFTISQSVFKTMTGLVRPNEGDLVYLPLDKKVYEIKFVDHQNIFYQLGKLQVYDLQLELLEFNGEVFKTGIPEIDAISTLFPMIDDDTMNPVTDWIDQSKEIEADSDKFIDFTETDPFARGGKL